ncbi:hypothetical protein [Archaeoglobus fulgidus]|uniref:hypothetical protein n=1 Tax=Archaeoglobus fulgidus TaxID=2234 RepID=UPI000B3646A6|nr:hypothetical protein [Archaeoglobus fulgidus]
MRKVLAALLALVVVGVVAASAQGFRPAVPKLEINESNFEDVKAKILSHLEERIEDLQKLKEDVENADSADELKSVMEEHALSRAKDMTLRKIDRAIERLESSGNSDAVSELESLKDKVSSATSMEELRQIMEEFRGIMEDAGFMKEGIPPKMPCGGMPEDGPRMPNANSANA